MLFLLCVPKQWNSLHSDCHHIQSSHAFKTTIKLTSTSNFKFCLLTCTPLYSSLHSCGAPVCVCVCVCVCTYVCLCEYVRITISLYNNYFWGFYQYIFVDLVLKSMVCSPLSVRYGAIKITAIIMIKNGPGHSEQCQKLNLRQFTIQCVSCLLSFFQLQWLCCWSESSIHFSMPWYRKAWGVNILKQKETKTN